MANSMRCGARAATPPVTRSYPYVHAVYFVFYTIGTVGYGDVDLSGTVEKWYACVVLFGALLTNGFIVGKLISIMQRHMGVT